MIEQQEQLLKTLIENSPDITKLASYLLANSIKLSELMPIFEKYGNPDFTTYPITGYDYSTWAQIISDYEEETKTVTEYHLDVAQMLATQVLAELEDSPLDKGYLVFVAVRGKRPVHIGINAGRNMEVVRKHNPLKTARDKYGSNCVLILAYGLSQVQALNIQRTLKRRLKL
jgi:hypothetical protein